VARWLWPAAAQLLGPGAEPPVGLAPIGNAAVAIWIAAGALWLLLRVLARRAPESVGTWDCGYAAPTPRMQYTASSFSEHLVTRLFPPWLRPLAQRVSLKRPFPGPARFATENEDPLTRAAYRPLLSRWADRFARIRWMQQGQLPLYVVYVLGAVLLALAWLQVRGWISP
jgi:hypothetical protein